jgi:multimeric flavodoxin WrbA
MLLTIFNGSPRGKQSNSRFLCDAFMKGYIEKDDGKDIIQIIDLIEVAKIKSLRSIFAQSDHVIIAFPLYIDSMPAQVKYFFETLKNYKMKKQIQSIGFFVQSGFPGKIHSTFIEQYLSNFSMRLGCQYMGTVIKGGGESIKISALQKKIIHRLIFKIAALTDLGRVGHLVDNKKHFNHFYELGKQYKKFHYFDSHIIKKLDRPKKINWFNYSLYKFIAENFYWNTLLKRYNSTQQRDNTPYS